ncbi:CAP domain-containing protein [Deinococcus ruber]|uniref:SCP domain-containing protein n=1 Tax=Deinococcus ruber TaxID=1848197 RepID=A0A918FHF8_9DEIO|nr:CAP domain-containing protein [Deinococcus ruber]GGR37923.1 hypothetical protein GCM10008957_54030 [Deinococcus ruber]
MKLKTIRPLFPAALLALILTACSQDTVPTPNAPGFVYTVDPAYQRSAMPFAPDTWGTEDQVMLDTINAARSRGITCHDAAGQATIYPPAPAVQLEGHLLRAATWQAQDMSARNYMQHQAPAPAPHGTMPIERIANAGYRPANGIQIGENLARGYTDPAAVVLAWLGSTKGHCETLANANWTDIGIWNQNGFWAAEFARPVLE